MESVPHILWNHLKDKGVGYQYTNKQLAKELDVEPNCLAAASSKLQKHVGAIKAVCRSGKELTFEVVSLDQKPRFHKKPKEAPRSRRKGYHVDKSEFISLPDTKKPKRKSPSEALIDIAILVAELERDAKTLSEYDTEELYAELRRRNAQARVA
jgi:hypothetical protein